MIGTMKNSAISVPVFGSYLYECLPQRRHNVSWVENRQTSQYTHCSLPDFKYFIVHSYKQGAEIFSLGQMLIETFI
jgi:hypothetical protein